MKNLIFLLIPLLFACHRVNENTHYIDTKVIIVQSNEECLLSQDKYHQPILVKSWLVQSLDDTTMFRELLSEGGYYNDWHISNEEWYNHKVGDTLYFNYLFKQKFFKIYKPLKPN